MMEKREKDDLVGVGTNVICVRLAVKVLLKVIQSVGFHDVEMTRIE